jgi:hypothetical protein
VGAGKKEGKIDRSRPPSYHPMVCLPPNLTLSPWNMGEPARFSLSLAD